MKTRSLLLALGCLAGLLWTTPAAQAQATTPAAPKKEILVEVDKVNIELQKTPDFQVQNVKQKRFTPKDWIELEVDCKAKLSKDEKDKTKKAYGEVVFKYYAYFSGNPDPKKNRVLTGEVTHVNVAIGEQLHSVMYISPQSILKITEGRPANQTMVSQWGVAVFIDGTEVGRKTSQGGAEWWTKPGLPATEAALLDKTKTPFSPLWYDYHMEVRAK